MIERESLAPLRGGDGVTSGMDFAPASLSEEILVRTRDHGLDPVLAGSIGQQLETYDPLAPQAAHLRGHQIEAIEHFRHAVRSRLDGKSPNVGMAILHPTGSGKTVTTAEVVRMLCGNTSQTEPVRALMLVPGHQILSQTTGTEEEVGAIQAFAPELSVGEYSGKRKSVDSDVTVMTYQALPWAVARGDIDAINPGLIICDEAHHVIDGTWAKAVDTISEGRLLLGLTATPSYTASRNVTALFPEVLVRKSMKEGIEEGILSEMQGFVYRGVSRLSISRMGADYDDMDLYRAIANSDDNYLAAKIVAREVELGRRGVVSCVPGFDRAHAKYMAEILSRTEVDTPDGRRTIRAEFVGGEIPQKGLRDIFNRYKNGQIDVITYVNLLLEGWDSPQSDFTVMLRPTMSRVLTEQRLGRIVRPREGKVATVHEILYRMPDGSLPQMTHLDVMEQTTVKQGLYYGNRKDKKTRERKLQYKQRAARIFSMDDYMLDPELAARIAELDALPVDELRVACGQEAIPFTWRTSQLLSTLFGEERESIEALLQEAAIPARYEEHLGQQRLYYPPRATEVIAEKLGIVGMPEGFLTLSDIVTFHRSMHQYRTVGRKTVEQALADEGVFPSVYLRPDGSLVTAYAPESLEVPPVLVKRFRRREDVVQKELETEEVPDTKKVAEWLMGVLVNPRGAPTNWEQRRIMTGQNCLLAAINNLPPISDWDFARLQDEVKQLELSPNNQMLNVMSAKRLDFIGLLKAAHTAYLKVNALEKAKK